VLFLEGTNGIGHLAQGHRSVDHGPDLARLEQLAITEFRRATPSVDASRYAYDIHLANVVDLELPRLATHRILRGHDLHRVIRKNLMHGSEHARRPLPRIESADREFKAPLVFAAMCAMGQMSAKESVGAG
jgi:hypothetical protein